jgi:hypothetical protein
MRVTPTIPIATPGARVLINSFTNDDWQRIEAAYGYSVPVTAREQIQSATLKFAFSAELEGVAQPVKESREHLLDIKHVMAAACDKLFKNPQDERWDSRCYANRLLERNVREAGLAGRRRYSLRSLDSVLVSVIAGCDLSLEQLENPKNQGPRNGDAWEEWVRCVSQIAEAHGLPTGASKGKDRNKTKSPPSAFVTLIRELQELIPEKYRRSTHSVGALAAAICSARALPGPN